MKKYLTNMIKDKLFLIGIIEKDDYSFKRCRSIWETGIVQRCEH